MNSFVKYDPGSSASEFFERARRTDADFRRRIYDLRIAMYKTTYGKSFYWPDHIPKSNNHQVKPEFTMIPKPNEDQYKQLYTPNVLIFKKMGENKRIIPSLEYSTSTSPKITYYKDEYTNKVSQMTFNRIMRTASEDLPIYSCSDWNLCQVEDLSYSDTHAKSLYQESYINWTPSQAHKKEETPEEWSQKWRNECHNVRDADDLVQDLSNGIIKSRKMILNRKKIGYA